VIRRSSCPFVARPDVPFCTRPILRVTFGARIRCASPGRRSPDRQIGRSVSGTCHCVVAVRARRRRTRTVVRCARERQRSRRGLSSRVPLTRRFGRLSRDPSVQLEVADQVDIVWLELVEVVVDLRPSGEPTAAGHRGGPWPFHKIPPFRPIFRSKRWLPLTGMVRRVRGRRRMRWPRTATSHRVCGRCCSHVWPPSSR
jgi:hypothetical protein